MRAADGYATGVSVSVSVMRRVPTSMQPRYSARQARRTRCVHEPSDAWMVAVATTPLEARRAHVSVSMHMMMLVWSAGSGAGGAEAEAGEDPHRRRVRVEPDGDVGVDVNGVKHSARLTMMRRERDENGRS